jgi:hypothetical protein
VFGKLHTDSLPIVYKSHTAEGCQAPRARKVRGAAILRKRPSYIRLASLDCKICEGAAL